MASYFKTIGLSVSFLCAFVSSAFALEPVELSITDKMILEAGLVTLHVWKDTSVPHDPTALQGGIDIDAPLKVIWDIMLSCDAAMQVSSDIKECKILEAAPDRSWDIRYQKIGVSPLLPRFKTTFKTEYISERILKISKVSGDLKVQEGLWELRPLSDNKTRVLYQARLAPKLPLPSHIIRSQTHKGIPRVLENLRFLAESKFQDALKSVRK